VTEAGAATTKPRGLTQELVLHANVVLPGLYAWVTTVAYPAAQRGATAAARVTALLALIALFVGPPLAEARPRLGRLVGLPLFVGLGLLSWLMLGALLDVDRLEPVRAALGSVGWLLYAFGWGDIRRPGSVPEDDPNVLPGAPLAPRSTLPRASALVFGIGVVGAVIPLLVAWRELRPRHALLAHTLTLLWAVLLTGAAARIAVARGEQQLPAPRQRLGSALRPLAVLALLLVLGLLWWLFR
jgi:hypothetical protein